MNKSEAFPESNRDVVSVLLRERSEDLTAKLRKILPRSLFELDIVQSGTDLVHRLAVGQVDVVLIDLSVPTIDNRRSFDAVLSLDVPPPVLVYGGRDSFSTMTKFIKHGAHSFFNIEDEPDIIIHAIRQAANNYAVTRENESLKGSLFKRERTVEVLERLGEAMSTVFDVRKILKLTLKVVRRALDSEICCLYLLDSDSGKLVDSRNLGGNGDQPQLELWGSEGSGLTRNFLDRAAGIAFAESRLLSLENREEILVLGKGLKNSPGDGELRNIIAVPLNVRNSTSGVIIAANKLDQEEFTPEDLEIIQSVARQTAFVLEGMRSRKREQSFQGQLTEQVDIATKKLKERNLELSQRLHEREEANRKIQEMAEEITEKNVSLKAMIEQFRVIHEISQVIGSELENESLLKKIISETATLLKAKTVSLMLKDSEGSLVIKHALGLSSDVIKKTRVRPGEGIAGWVAEEGKPILVRDVRKIKKSRSDNTNYMSDSLLCAPLTIKGDVTGILNVTNRDGGGSFDEKDLFLLTILGNHAAIAIENARLYGAIRENYFNTIKALVNAVEAKDNWTKDHSENVTNYSLKMADFLGLSEKQKEIIRYAGVLHDIGKIVISNSITDKPGKLNDDEWEKMREHPLIGQRILDPIDFLEPVKICIQTHHERCDGSGYPFGLLAHEIPLETRIISVADAYDAMTHSRPYREALTVMDAVDELKRSSGSQFDPKVVDSLVRIIEAEGFTHPKEQ
ncbi:MAG: HD domain-containing phosphohydrolase [bacterium]